MNKINRRQFIYYSSLSLGASLVAGCSAKTTQVTSNSTSSATNNKLDKITFGINWFAEPEYGGFYQALATGIYQKYGLDVIIKVGGPRVNGTQLLMSGVVDFFIGDATNAIKAIQAGIPKITVASIFQKDPRILLAHPNVGNDSLENLKGKPIYITGTNAGFWTFLKAKYGFTDEQARPYYFSVVPFIKDKNSAQQGYITSEAFKVEKEAGFKPLIFLLADYGYNPYTNNIETRKELVDKNPDLVQRFVDASIKGWYSYLANPAPANELIKQENPEMSDDLIAYGLESMKKYGIIISGDAEINGIGAMTESRWKEFFENQVALGVFKPETDYKQAFTLKFVNKKVTND
ncbi:MAG: ABC transporter substrate-binding protein [Moorea sp. SIO2B7]|nr:ABC transporter substrate-binding protein [Moorena sp. SIO2B7]